MTDARCIHLEERGLLAISGEDRVAFLQGLVSNDVHRVSSTRSLYASLLTPQGKYLFDFVMIGHEDSLLLDCEADRLEALRKRLSIYRLRSRVDLADVTGSWQVHAAWGDGALAALGLPGEPGATVHHRDGIAIVDPRHAGLGARLVTRRGTDPVSAPFVHGDRDDYDAIRIALGVPDGVRDLEVGRTVLLEAGFDELNGIDWDKGCYMGQELTARTRYRGLVKRRLTPVVADGAVPGPGTPVTLDGREVGEIRSGTGDRALALLRLAALEAGANELLAGDVRVRPSTGSR